jgi:fatty acid desaturase
VSEHTAARTAAGRGEERGSDYAALLRHVRGAGLLDRRPGYYTVKLGTTAAMLAAGIAAFILLGDTWWQLATAAYLAVVFAQIGFVGHDAGHRQIFRHRRANTLTGVVCANLLIGLSYGWWVDKHNRHHAHPNEVGQDPDVSVGALVFTAQQARERHGLSRMLARGQAWFFFPLLLLEGVSLHLASVKALLHRPDRAELAESGLLLVHAAAYFASILLFLPPLKAVVFIVAQQGLFGLYLGCAFAPNHKGMPELSDSEAADYLRRQVLTSRNVRGGLMTDWILGGLNYQIEHHLFPSMPRANLGRVQHMVRAFCAEHGIEYRECSAVGSYRQALRHLHAVGATPAAVS